MGFFLVFVFLSLLGGPESIDIISVHIYSLISGQLFDLLLHFFFYFIIFTPRSRVH